LRIVESAAEENHLLRVHKVILEIGQFAGVIIPSLEFAFSVIKKDTILENTEIEINSPPLLLSCHACEAEYLADLEDLSCPVCQAEDFDILQGREMLVKSIIGE